MKHNFLLSRPFRFSTSLFLLAAIPSFGFVRVASSTASNHRTWGGGCFVGVGTATGATSSFGSRRLFAADTAVEIRAGGQAEEKMNGAAAEDHHHVKAEYAAKTESALERYKKEHARSIEDPAGFWAEKATSFLDWDKEFVSAMHGDLTNGNVSWFLGGKLNVAYNAVDRHVFSGKGDVVAMIWEGDEPDDVRRITYNELLAGISRIANALTARGVGKGDVVTIYMPMVPEIAMCMLACARIGAVHSIVFAGFSSEALAQRISAGRSKFLITADQGLRGGKTIPLKKIVDDARTKLDCEELMETVFVWERFFEKEKDIPYKMKPKDCRMDLLVAGQRPYSVPVSMDAEDPLFILYTSGSTGTPKGLVHTTGGYSLYAAFTTKTTFDLVDGDIFACMADCGWITGEYCTH